MNTVQSVCQSRRTEPCASPYALGGDSTSENRWAACGVPESVLRFVVMVVLLCGITGAARGVTPEQAIGAFARAEKLVRSGLAEDPGSACSPAGAAVTLRLGSTVIGRGDDFEGGPDAVLRATAQAFAQAATRWADTDERAVALGRLAEAVALHVELIESFERVTPERALEPPLAPGLEGYALRLDDSSRRGVFPSRMRQPRIAELGPRAVRLVAPTGLIAMNTPSDELVEQFHIESFRVTEIGQSRAGQPPRFLVRGRRLVESESMGVESLRSLLQKHAGVLAAAVARMPDGSTDLVLQGVRSTRVASDIEVAAAALALARAGGRFDGSTGLGFKAVSARLLRILEDRDQDREQEPGPGVAALCVVAIQQLGDAAAGIETERFKNTMLAAIPVEQGASPVASGVLAFGLASMGGMDEEARSVLTSVYTAGGINAAASAQPWAAWAELELSDRTLEWARRVPLLRELRRVAWSQQLGRGIDRETLRDRQPDLIGGLKLAGSDWPDWRSTRLLAAAAAMLGDPVLTPDEELAGEILPVIDGARFLAQLTGEDGWVSTSTWSDERTIQGQVIGILMLCELLEALEKRSGEGGGK